MTTPKKTQIVEELEKKLQKAKSLVLVDYSGLSVSQQQELRKKVIEAGGEFTVTKNTLLKLAFEQSSIINHQSSIINFLIGPTATLFAYEDEIAAIKALVNFAEEFELPKIKAGFFEGKAVDKDFLVELAKIPSKQELITKLVYLVNSPIYGLANVLSANQRKLVVILPIIKRGGDN
jgi:large subunit ribosomal protein L10